MKVGQARYGGGKKTFKIKDGDNVYGILPPLGELADKGKWSQYYRIEWGYKDSAGKHKPFQDVRAVNRKTKMVEVESAAHLHREQLKKEKEDLVALFKAGQASKEQVNAAVEKVRQFNLDCKHYLNVINQNGEIGLLKIGHRAKVALDAAIEALRGQGIEPIGLTGVFFNLNRFIPNGKPLDTTYTITPYQENIQAEVNGQVQMVQQRKVYTLTDDIIQRLANEAFELSKLYPVVTANDVQRMVTEGAVAVDEIFGVIANDTQTAAAPVQQTAVVEPQAAPVVAQAEPVVTEPVVAEPVVAEPVVAEPVVTTQAEPVVEPKDISNEDFLKSIGAI